MRFKARDSKQPELGLQRDRSGHVAGDRGDVGQIDADSLPLGRGNRQQRREVAASSHSRVTVDHTDGRTESDRPVAGGPCHEIGRPHDLRIAAPLVDRVLVGTAFDEPVAVEDVFNADAGVVFVPALRRSMLLTRVFRHEAGRYPDRSGGRILFACQRRADGESAEG